LKNRPPKFPKLSNTNVRAYDAVVIGAGITGLTAAWLLKQAGKRVCVLERDRVGAVDTGHTTAHLTMVTDLRLTQLAKHFGKAAARLTWQGGAAAVNTVEEIVKRLNIQCQFTRIPGYLFAAIDGKQDESGELKREAKLARDLGFDATFLPAVPYFSKPGIRFSNQAKFHPLQYLSALAQDVDGGGSAVFEQTEVSEVSGEPQTVKVGKLAIKCDFVVIATHVPLMGKTGLVNATLFQTKLAPYSSYVVGAKLPRGAVPEASFWDTSDPYYYLRIDRGTRHDYAIFGGLDHKTGQEPDVEQRFFELRAKLYALVPQAETADYQWSGQVIETNDGLPYIGETAERQFAATGFAGNGTTFGTLAGMMACDAALGRENPWRQLFSVNRKKLRGGTWDYLTENFDYPYYLVRDRLAPAEGDSPRSVKRGEGKILKIDGNRVACYRDEEGRVSQVSAVCTHMGCLVRWNNAEHTWDCPCHGSRFHPTGEVLAGPAESPLEPVDEQPGSNTSRSKMATSKSAQAPTARKKKPARRHSAARRSDR
jgi:glycine/D-amino acid oxidase-like deaminating enzyme/nitrite reductase/ring-hydroxylating ferredoxin subunit